MLASIHTTLGARGELSPSDTELTLVREQGRHLASFAQVMARGRQAAALAA